MITKYCKLKVFVVLTLLTGINICFAGFSQSTKEIFDEIYSSGKMNESSAVTLIKKINQASFERESHRVMALLQVRSSTENAEMLKEAKNLAESYINSGADSSEKDLVKIGLSAILSLSGERMAGCKLAEKVLENVDFKQLTKENESYASYIASRYNIVSIGPERFFKDELRRQIGGYYLNRRNDEGGPDFQRAYDVFFRISVQEVRDSCLFDARLRGLKQSASTEVSVELDPGSSPTNNQPFKEDSGDTQSRQLKNAPPTKQSASRNGPDSMSDVARGLPLWQWIAGLCFLVLAALLVKRIISGTTTKPPSAPL
jgi:hypothetical protein